MQARILSNLMVVYDKNSKCTQTMTMIINKPSHFKVDLIISRPFDCVHLIQNITFIAKFKRRNHDRINKR